jgi:heptosyltransferase II
MNLGIILPKGLGEVAMATPMLRALRKQFPRPTRLVGVLRRQAADVLAGTPWLDESISYQSGTSKSSWNAARELRRRRLDAVVLLDPSYRAAAVACLSGAARRIGYAGRGRGMVLTDRLDPPRSGPEFLPVSAVDYFLELAYYLGCPTESRRLALATTLDDERAAERVWEKSGLAHARRVVAIHAGGGSAATRWPAEHAAILARRVAVELDAAVLVLCGPNEGCSAAQIARLANHPRVASLSDEPLSVGLTKACIRRAAAMIATDSGPRHLAAAFDIPTVTLFGPNDSAISANYNPRAIDLRLSLACRPCRSRTCPLQHHRCMQDLTPDRVFGALVRVLQKAPPQQRIESAGWRPARLQVGERPPVAQSSPAIGSAW